MSNHIISGTGVDIESIDRFRTKPYDSNTDFYRKIFTDSEIEYCLRFKDPSPHFTARFCAKESLRKAIPKTIHIDWHDVEIRNDKNGKPYFSFSKTVLGDNAYFSSRQFHLSLSHEKNHAIAFVVTEHV